MMTFDQLFVAGWNPTWNNLTMRIGEESIKRVNFTSPFSQFMQEMTVGNYLQETYINPAKVFLHETITNTHMLENITDEVFTTIHSVNIDLNIASTYKEPDVRLSFNFFDNVNLLITSFVANLQVTAEITKMNLVKQMLYNYWAYGMIDSALTTDPRLGVPESEAFLTDLLVKRDDFGVEPNTRGVIYNNRLDTTTDIVSMGTKNPWTIMFTDYLRGIEVRNTISLHWGDFRSGNTNQDYATRLIMLNSLDFPNAIPPNPRSEVVGQNVEFSPDINFFEIPTDAEGEPLYPNEPQAGTRPVAFIIDDSSFLFRTQLNATTNFQNPGTLATTNRLILRLMMSVSGFEKITALATGIALPPAKND